jgi:hypothetical protein
MSCDRRAEAHVGVVEVTSYCVCAYAAPALTFQCLRANLVAEVLIHPATPFSRPGDHKGGSFLHMALLISAEEIMFQHRTSIYVSSSRVGG